MKSLTEIGVFIAVVLLSTVPFCCGSGCDNKLDVAFLVDESGSVGRFNFEDVKAFMRDVVNASFDVGPNKTRIAMLTYSSGYRKRFTLKDLDTKEAVLAKIHAVDYLGGSTETHIAIRMARLAILNPRKPVGARSDAKQIAIVITDGASNNPALTKSESELARDQGIEIYALAIGKRITSQELDTIASKPLQEHIFVADSFKKLGDLSNSFKSVGCSNQQTTTEAASTTAAETTTRTFTSQTTSAPHPTPISVLPSVSVARGATLTPALPHSTPTPTVKQVSAARANPPTRPATPTARGSPLTPSVPISTSTIRVTTYDTNAPNVTKLNQPSDKNKEENKNKDKEPTDQEEQERAVAAGMQKFLDLSNPVVQTMVVAGSAFLGAVGILACCLLIFFLKKRRPRVSQEEPGEDEDDGTKPKISPKVAWEEF